MLLLGPLLSENARAQEFTVTVDYSRPLLQFILDGQYETISRDFVSQNFPEHAAKYSVHPKHWNSQVITTIEIIPLNHTYTSDALIRLHEWGYRPANFYELLALGEELGQDQRYRLIAALGSGDPRHITYLEYNSLGWHTNEGYSKQNQVFWNGEWWFAAVRH